MRAFASNRAAGGIFESPPVTKTGRPWGGAARARLARFEGVGSAEDDAVESPHMRIDKLSEVSRRAAIDCTVRNISEIGAALEVMTPLYIPDRFTCAVDSGTLL